MRGLYLWLHQNQKGGTQLEVWESQNLVSILMANADILADTYFTQNRRNLKETMLKLTMNPR